MCVPKSRVRPFKLGVSKWREVEWETRGVLKDAHLVSDIHDVHSLDSYGFEHLLPSLRVPRKLTKLPAVSPTHSKTKRANTIVSTLEAKPCKAMPVLSQAFESSKNACQAAPLGKCCQCFSKKIHVGTNMSFLIPALRGKDQRPYFGSFVIQTGVARSPLELSGGVHRFYS